MTQEIKPRRRLWGIPLSGVVLLIPAIAIALIVHTLYIQGTINTGSAAVKYSTGAGVTTNSGDCAGTYSDDQHLDLTWNPLPFAGDTCNITVVFAANGNSVAMKLQGVSLPAGLNGLLGGDCGKLLNVGDPLTPAAALDLEIDPAHPTGTPIVITADTFGFDWVPAVDYNPALCA